MVNYIKNHSASYGYQGLFFVRGKNGAAYDAWVTANTPGDCDLDLLTENTTWIYFDSVMRLQCSWTSIYEDDVHIGFRTYPGKEEAETDYYTGGADRQIFLAIVETDRATCEGMETVMKYWNKATRINTEELILVRQYATTTFRQFSNQNIALKKYLPVIINGISYIELGTTDKQELTISGISVW